MKLFAAAAIVLLSLAFSLSYAEQNTTPVRQNQRDKMIIPSEHNDSPF
ncbi:multiple antibiotic resistance regulatory protein MarB, partial [Escherichia coli]|nr:multiple antibiotic resistance regulatory protein MarB [Escherichia coli]